MNMNNTLPVTFTTGCAIEKDYIYIVAKLDSLHQEDKFARIYIFDDQKNHDKWVHHDLADWEVVSVCIRKATTTSPRMVCALSENGELELRFVDGAIIEKIPGAGLADSNSSGYGYVNAIREIGNHLYVCGLSGQVYRRSDDGWSHFDHGLLQSMDATEKAVEQLKLGNSKLMQDVIEDTFSLRDINGLTETDIYTVGDEGRIFHHDGNRWTELTPPNNENLIRVKCISENEVWICGDNGTLLKGNWRDGFKDVSSVGNNDIFLSVEKFNDLIYISTENELFIYDNEKILPLETNLKPELQDAHLLEAKDGVLWSFGYKDLAYFDGKTWTRVDHPDNSPIR